MDFMEMPKSLSGNKYCLVMMDYYTKWPEVFAVADQQALTVARALLYFVSRHGIPQVLHSDQGRLFDNEVIREVCKMLGIQKVRTSSYHPEADGLVERMNRTILQMLSKYAAEQPTEWDLFIQPLVGAYRTAVQASTGFSPFALVYGRKASAPVDIALGSGHQQQPSQYTAYYEKLRQAHRIARESVEEHVTEAQAKQVDAHGTNARYVIRYWLTNIS